MPVRLDIYWYRNISMLSLAERQLRRYGDVNARAIG
jgi:hypothetical protein